MKKDCFMRRSWLSTAEHTTWESRKNHCAWSTSPHGLHVKVIYSQGNSWKRNETGFSMQNGHLPKRIACIALPWESGNKPSPSPGIRSRCEWHREWRRTWQSELTAEEFWLQLEVSMRLWACLSDLYLTNVFVKPKKKRKMLEVSQIKGGAISKQTHNRKALFQLSSAC